MTVSRRDLLGGSGLVVAAGRCFINARDDRCVVVGWDTTALQAARVYRSSKRGEPQAAAETIRNSGIVATTTTALGPVVRSTGGTPNFRVVIKYREHRCEGKNKEANLVKKNGGG